MIYKKDYFGFVYKWTDSKTNMKYIGSHHGSLDDSYKGSNQRFLRAIKKRPEYFTREILEFIAENNCDIVLACEQKWLDSVPDIKNNLEYFNQKNKAKGGWSFITDNHVKLRAETLKIKHSISGLSSKEKDSYKKKIEKRLDRISKYGFTEKEKEQHSKYGYKVKVIDPAGIEYVFDSCAKAKAVLNIDIQYGLKVCKEKETFKGYKCIKLQDPIIDCRGFNE